MVPKRWRCAVHQCSAELAREEIVVEAPELRCPACSTLDEGFFLIRAAFASVESTEDKTAAAYPWIRRHESRSLSSPPIWAFSDGSSTGAHAAIVLLPAEKPAEFVVPAPAEQPVTRNVAAEIAGAALALENCPLTSSVILVSDFLGTGAWGTGRWTVRSAEVLAGIDRVARAARKLESVAFIHHGGHQKDDSDFTRWNNAVDRLCSSRARRPRAEASDPVVDDAEPDRPDPVDRILAHPRARKLVIEVLLDAYDCLSGGPGAHKTVSGYLAHGAGAPRTEWLRRLDVEARRLERRGEIEGLLVRLPGRSDREFPSLARDVFDLLAIETEATGGAEHLRARLVGAVRATAKAHVEGRHE